MSRNRSDLVIVMNQASSVLLQEKGFISFVDILISVGILTKEDYERWRFGKVPCLEAVVSVNLAKLNFLLRTLHQNSLNGNLRPSPTAYMSWGKGKKRPLRFSKSGDVNLEKAYSTHYVQKNRQENA